jgi:hypothetical protein
MLMKCLCIILSQETVCASTIVGDGSSEFRYCNYSTLNLDFS